MDLGLLILRLLVATILFTHATQKLWGWFAGPGMDATTALFQGLGQRPASIMVRVAIGSELLGALLLASGAGTPLGVLIVVSTMVVAGASLCLAKGSLWNAAGGGEYPFVLAAVTSAIGFTGPGRWSVDAAVGAAWVGGSSLWEALLGCGLVVVAAAAATPPVIRTRRALAANTP